jgi:hypothetical protein
MPCNKSGSDIDRRYWGTSIEAELYLSDDDISDIDALIGMGAGASGVYAKLVQRGVLAGALSSSYAAIIGGVIAFYIGWIKYSNNGCGVELSMTLTPFGSHGVSVQAQTEDDGWWPFW